MNKGTEIKLWLSTIASLTHQRLVDVEKQYKKFKKGVKTNATTNSKTEKATE